jgi:hypothetical protein
MFYGEQTHYVGDLKGGKKGIDPKRVERAFQG